jgi:pantoate--beta-alanine ligase
MSLAIIDTVAALREAVAVRRREGGIVGLVPTMGALHAGHASLIERARRDCRHVVVTIFVNPLQFDRKDDLAAYPRTLEADAALCSELGVDIVFAPNAADMYPAPPVVSVDPGDVATHLCGRYRPGHFRGVATVVMKLFQISHADVAFFGEKDAQQLAVIRAMVRDLNVPIRVEGVPTVRDADGLALSSRNQRLSAEERRLAPMLYAALRQAVDALSSGVRQTEPVRTRASALIPKDPRLRLEYLDVVDAVSFQPVSEVRGPVTIAGALWVGNTRLIDNVRWEA